MKTISKKVCLLGDFAVGKTSLVRRFVHNVFDDKYISTIGVKVSRKTVVTPRADAMIELTMMLWDLAGNKKFNHMQTSYLLGASGAVLVCDITRADTLAALQAYAKALRKINPAAQLVIAGNKYDLIKQQQLSQEQLAAAAAEFDAPWYLTSAKTGEQVETIFRQLGQQLVSNGGG